MNDPQMQPPAAPALPENSAGSPASDAANNTLNQVADIPTNNAADGTVDKDAPMPWPGPVEPVLLSAARVSTFDGERLLTGATGFFFQRDGRLYLVTSRHVLIDEPSAHFPNRVEIELHADARNLTRSVCLSVLLYLDGKATWRQGSDSGGEIDVAVLELQRAALSPEVQLFAFTPQHLQRDLHAVEVGAPLLVVGFPLGFHDGVHHLPVARQASVASSFGVRFQGHGFFLTDARTHRGTSGAPVVMRLPGQPSASADNPLPWKLLGVHSARMDMGNRDQIADESLGLNCTWYADILMTLTQPPLPAPTVESAPAA